MRAVRPLSWAIQGLLLFFLLPVFLQAGGVSSRWSFPPSPWHLYSVPIEQRKGKSPRYLALTLREREAVKHWPTARRRLEKVLSARRGRFPASHHEEFFQYWVTYADALLVRSWAVHRAALLHLGAERAQASVLDHYPVGNITFWLHLVNRRMWRRWDDRTEGLQRRIYLEVDGRILRPAFVTPGFFGKLRSGQDFVVGFSRRLKDGSLTVPPKAKKIFFLVTGLPNRRERVARVRLNPKLMRKP